MLLDVGSIVVVKRDGTDGSAFPWTDHQKEIVFGRNDACDIRISLAEVSKRHARLYFDADKRCWLEPMSQNSVTMLNGKVIHDTMQLFTGDYFEIFSRKFRFITGETFVANESSRMMREVNRDMVKDANFNQASKFRAPFRERNMAATPVHKSVRPGLENGNGGSRAIPPIMPSRLSRIGNTPNSEKKKAARTVDTKGEEHSHQEKVMPSRSTLQEKSLSLEDKISEFGGKEKVAPVDIISTKVFHQSEQAKEDSAETPEEVMTNEDAENTADEVDLNSTLEHISSENEQKNEPTPRMNIEPAQASTTVQAATPVLASTPVQVSTPARSTRKSSAKKAATPFEIAEEEPSIFTTEHSAFKLPAQPETPVRASIEMDDDEMQTELIDEAMLAELVELSHDQGATPVRFATPLRASTPLHCATPPRSGCKAGAMDVVPAIHQSDFIEEAADSHPLREATAISSYASPTVPATMRPLAAQNATCSPSESKISAEGVNGLEPGDYCECCHGVHDENKILLCDGCDKGWHLYCLVPKKRSIPKNDWFCVSCVEAKNNPPPVVEEQAPTASVDLEYFETRGEEEAEDCEIEIGSSMKSRTPIIDAKEEGASSVVPKGKNYATQGKVSENFTQSIPSMPILNDTATNVAVEGQDDEADNGEEALSHESKPVENCLSDLPVVPDGLAPGDYCECCHGVHDESKILLCDGCDKGWHLYCLVPKKRSIPKNDWFCSECKSSTKIPSPQAKRAEKNASSAKRKAEDAASSRPVARRSRR